jgi:hypothetical protein
MWHGEVYRDFSRPWSSRADMIPGRSSGGRSRECLPDEVESVIRQVLRTRYLNRQRRSLAAVPRKIIRIRSRFCVRIRDRFRDRYQGVGRESSSALRSSRAATWVRKPFNSRSICASAVLVCRSFR